MIRQKMIEMSSQVLNSGYPTLGPITLAARYPNPTGTSDMPNNSAIVPNGVTARPIKNLDGSPKSMRIAEDEPNTHATCFFVTEFSFTSFSRMVYEINTFGFTVISASREMLYHICRCESHLLFGTTLTVSNGRAPDNELNGVACRTTGKTERRSTDSGAALEVAPVGLCQSCGAMACKASIRIYMSVAGPSASVSTRDASSCWACRWARSNPSPPPTFSNIRRSALW